MTWEKLEAILRDNLRRIEEEQTRPPETCPFDGARLEVVGRVRNCPMGNYRWEG